MGIFGKGLGGIKNHSIVPLISLDVVQDIERDLGAQVQPILDRKLCYNALAVKLALDLLHFVLHID